MYTSGWPNSQNRCCHRIGSPPAAVLKKLAPNCRSAVSSISATVIIGKANTSRILVTSVIHTNTGILIKDMPGARIFMIVTTKLKPAANEATPST